MNEKTQLRIIALLVAGYIIFALICLAVGLISRADTGTGHGDTGSPELHENGSSALEGTVGELENGISVMEEQMHGAGKQIESGITDVGELGAASGRIEGAGSDIAQSAGRIEEGILRIERIIQEAEKSCGLLENNSGCHGSDGGS